MKRKKQQTADTVVGIGASAGGLEALEIFFRHCPEDSGFAYVVIQHLSTQYKSMMEDLLSRYTSMPVHLAQNNQTLQPNNIYLIPAGQILTIEDHRIALRQKDETIFNLPINAFYKTLAEEYRDKSAAVILSGTGTDGTRGASEINAAGGLVIAQAPSEAKFDGMPASVISSGVVDDILNVEYIPQRIQAHFANQVRIVNAEEVTTSESEQLDELQDNFDAILGIVNDSLGLDFDNYKWATISRRLERRLQVCQLTELSDYKKKLLTDKNEQLALRKELLIPVTSFFRDNQIFESIENNIIPDIILSANDREGIRVWVAGCSTGEEAYSITILLLEEMAHLKKTIPLKVFATDVNPEVIEIASRGVYSESILSEVPKRFLTKYFTEHEGKFVVTPELRQSVVFATHNLLSDPPFTKLDLVSCRNVLIYFKKAAQELTQKKLQYGLKQGGRLILGKSESLLINQDKFSTEDKHSKIFRATSKISIKDFDTSSLKTRFTQNKSTDPNNNVSSVDKAWQAIKNSYVPTSILVDGDLNVLHVFGSQQGILRIQEGIFTAKLNHLLNDKLNAVVTTLFYRLKKELKKVEAANVISKINNEVLNIKISGEAIQQSDQSYLYLIVLERFLGNSNDAFDNDQPDTEESATEQSNRRQLELELSATRESLQTTIEELETTNEELQATNEELMASNEELQSSNEELQSVNEELNTINAEYHEKMFVLNQANADLDAMSQATEIASIFVDSELKITRFTPDSYNIFSFREQDIGRPLNEVSLKINYPSFIDDIKSTINTGKRLEKIIKTEDKSLFLVRMVFYKLAKNSTGVVTSFIDISKMNHPI